MAERARGYAPTMVVGLASAAAVAVGVARPWVTATAPQTDLPPVSITLEGADLAPVAAALGVMLLAAFGAVIATRGWVRRAVGVVIVISAALVLVATLRVTNVAAAVEAELTDRGWTGGGYDQSTEVWRWIVLAGSVGCLLAGAAVVRYGSDWATMGSRYDAPTSPARSVGDVTAAAPPSSDDSWSEAEVWKAIDQGHDPTRGPAPEVGRSE